jgi:hypothetical protein
MFKGGQKTSKIAPDITHCHLAMKCLRKQVNKMFFKAGGNIDKYPEVIMWKIWQYNHHLIHLSKRCDKRHNAFASTDFNCICSQVSQMYSKKFSLADILNSLQLMQNFDFTCDPLWTTGYINALQCNISCRCFIVGVLLISRVIIRINAF